MSNVGPTAGACADMVSEYAALNAALHNIEKKRSPIGGKQELMEVVLLDITSL